MFYSSVNILRGCFKSRVMKFPLRKKPFECRCPVYRLENDAYNKFPPPGLVPINSTANSLVPQSNRELISKIVCASRIVRDLSDYALYLEFSPNLVETFQTISNYDHPDRYNFQCLTMFSVQLRNSSAVQWYI